jgi:sec-independent protein translocase protein TatA
MPNVGPLEIVLLLVLALLLFGAKRLPEIGRSLGHGMREFKDSVSGDHPATTDAHHELEQIATHLEPGETAHVTVRETAAIVEQPPVVVTNVHVEPEDDI